jgi:hypothetical protein
MQLTTLDVATASDSGYSHWSIVDANGIDVWTDVTIWLDLDDDNTTDVDVDVVSNNEDAAADAAYTERNMCLPPGSYTLISVPDVPYVLSFQEAKLKCGLGSDYNFTLPVENEDESSGCIAVDAGGFEEEFAALQNGIAVNDTIEIPSTDAEVMDDTTADTDNLDASENEIGDSDDAVETEDDDTKNDEGGAETNGLDDGEAINEAIDEGQSPDTSSTATNNQADEIASSSFYAMSSTKVVSVGSLLLLVLLVTY